MAKAIKIEKTKGFRKTMVGEMLRLSTSAWGLVAALAWNDLIKQVITQHIKPLFGEDAGLMSQLVYTVIITIFAVTVTYQLSKLAKKD